MSCTSPKSFSINLPLRRTSSIHRLHAADFSWSRQHFVASEISKLLEKKERKNVQSVLQRFSHMSQNRTHDLILRCFLTKATTPASLIAQNGVCAKWNTHPALLASSTRETEPGTLILTLIEYIYPLQHRRDHLVCISKPQHLLSNILPS